MAIHIQDIEIFAEVDESLRSKVEALFVDESFNKGERITVYGESVDGLYLLEQGEVQVSIPGYDGVLATLTDGASFGELSLFNPEDVASATVTVSSDTAELLFCPRDALNLALQVDAKLAAGFYRGSTILISDRLKNTNQKISDEIAKSIQMARDLIDDISSAGELGTTQAQFENAGSAIVSSMTNIVKHLLVLKEKNRPISQEEITEIADQAKDVYYSDFAVFEKVNKQLKTLGQHLDNVNRVLSNQELVAVDEDMSLDDF
ncbi:MAG: cyclic nucleotide-binding domain-containing protein [Pseudomonadales bacterium]|nr:cyclic nucleotide-binding domain-containing protein [Pseudomonadales bacterium]MBO7007206.1 cyclic nucleotide-binding domain-containing protein [Pseudomonadales bacterium]